MHIYVYAYVCGYVYTNKCMCMQKFVRVSLEYMYACASTYVCCERDKRTKFAPPPQPYSSQGTFDNSLLQVVLIPPPPYQAASWVGTVGSQTKWPTEGKGCERHLMVCQDIHSVPHSLLKKKKKRNRHSRREARSEAHRVQASLLHHQEPR